MSGLIIVESPTKAKTIQRFLGTGYRVLSSYGHVRDLPKSELGVDAEGDFTPKYVIPPKARKTITLLKNAAQKSDKIILATDEDREGEAIAWHIAQALGLGKARKKSKASGEKNNDKLLTLVTKPYQRIVFHEITKSAIEDALKHPRDIDMRLVNAQQARRVLDRIVGYKLSPFLWKKIARGLSAGRVQSVAVRLMVEREREIQGFRSQEYWTIVARLLKIKYQISKIKNSEFEALLVKKDGKAINQFEVKNKEAADKIIRDLDGAEYRVASIEKKEIRRNPLPPFNTSALQQEAWKRLKFPAKLTMGLAQNLYERGFITYHRTDSFNLAEQALFAAKKFITAEYGENYWAGFLRKYKTKSKGAQEAHEAIRPAYPDKTPEELKSAELDINQIKLYDLIWRRFMACQMSQAVFDATTADIAANNYEFRATGQMMKFDGFLKIYPMKFKENDLPPLAKDEIVKLLGLLPSQHFTQPPPRYNEATLIKALEENGIGRPSTYAPIISTVQERNYVEKDEERRFRPTEIGIVVNDLLVAHFPGIVDIGFTAGMEENLDEIAQGRKKWVPVVKNFYAPFAVLLRQKYEEVAKEDVAQKPTEKLCPKCGFALILRWGKFGQFYACSSFPKCNHTEPLEKNVLGIKCPKCHKGEIVLKRTRTKKIFYGCDGYPECDFALWYKPTGENCPKCQSLIVERGKQKICSDKNCV